MTRAPDLRARLLAYHAALQPFDDATVFAAFATDASYDSPGLGQPLQGREAILAAFRTYFNRFPDQVAQDDDIALTGPLSARAYWSLTATDSQTGQTTTRRGTEDVSFAPDGLITAITVKDTP